MLIEIIGQEISKRHHVFFSQRLAYLEMHTTLRLKYARQNAVQIFSFPLDIRSLATCIQFKRLKHITRFPLI